MRIGDRHRLKRLWEGVRIRMKEIVTEELKMPYTKPALTKHKPLRDITAGDVSVIGGVRVLR